MNYNEEMFNELKNIGPEGMLIDIEKKDKGIMEDHFQLKKRSDEINQKNLTMFKEGNKNVKNNLACDSSIQSIIEMRQSLIGSILTLEEFGRLYEKTSVSDYFSLSSHSDSDFGVIRHLKREKKLIKRNYFIKKSCR